MEDNKSEIENWHLGAGIYLSFYDLRNSLHEESDTLIQLVCKPMCFEIAFSSRVNWLHLFCSGPTQSNLHLIPFFGCSKEEKPQHASCLSRKQKVGIRTLSSLFDWICRTALRPTKLKFFLLCRLLILIYYFLAFIKVSPICYQSMKFNIDNSFLYYIK